MASSKARTRNRPAQRPAAPGARATPTSPAKSTSPAKPAGNAKPTRQAVQASTAERRPPVVVEPEADRPVVPPLWVQLTSLALAILGLGISAYETYAHFNGNHLAGCSANPHSTFDCSAVITSSQSMVFGVFPVAILGLIFYVFVVAIMTPWAWRIQRREVGWLRLAAMISGMGFVMYLIYAELYQIYEVCEYCTGVHIATFLLFCLTVVSAAIWGLPKGRGPLRSG